MIIIKDTGDGRPANLTSDIFKFSSQTKTGTGNETGVGLGLSLCCDYTMLLKGHIWFTCDAVSGTSFYVELPSS